MKKSGFKPRTPDSRTPGTPPKTKKPYVWKKGKKTNAWEAKKREIKPAFEAAGITFCEVRREGCNGTMFLTWAHARKRRFVTDAELGVVALCCKHCHDIIEAFSHEDMHWVVMDVIANRSVQPFPIPDSAWKFTG